MPSSSKYSAPATYYSLHLRFVRIQITDDLFEVLVTNLDENEFPPCILKQLYSMRWGIETSFRKLKYTIGLSAFHSKKSEHILQEIFARLTLYNFSEFVTSHIAIRKKKRKHLYKINFSVAVYACRNLLL
ncbi:MAG: transposase, partial [Ruminococcus sp.]|nr:transposase [Ruminococcus sp.]